MTAAQEKVLMETHADTHELIGILNGTTQRVASQSDDIKDNAKGIDELKEIAVTKTDCKQARQAITAARWNIWRVISTVVPWIGMIIMILWGTRVLG